MDDDLTLVARYPSEEAATDAARSLVERGIGATVDRIPLDALHPDAMPSEPPAPPPPATGEPGETGGALDADAPTTPPSSPPPSPSSPPPDVLAPAGDATATTDEAGTAAPSPEPAADSSAVAAALAEVPGSGDWGLFAVAVDARRAAVLLGFDAPAQMDDPERQLEKPPVPWKPILIIWAIAMLVLPALGFIAAYYLAG